VLKHKYGAIRCERDGKKFPSKLERRYYDRLNLLQRSGEILFFIRQIPFDLPGNTKYVADYMTFLPSGDVEIVDVKGKMTPMSNLKIKQVESLYPVKIKIVTDKDF
jgi:Protein of unknown function (DUF1064)